MHSLHRVTTGKKKKEFNVRNHRPILPLKKITKTGYGCLDVQLFRTRPDTQTTALERASHEQHGEMTWPCCRTKK